MQARWRSGAERRCSDLLSVPREIHPGVEECGPVNPSNLPLDRNPVRDRTQIVSTKRTVPLCSSDRLSVPREIHPGVEECGPVNPSNLPFNRDLLRDRTQILSAKGPSPCALDVQSFPNAGIFKISEKNIAKSNNIRRKTWRPFTLLIMKM